MTVSTTKNTSETPREGRPDDSAINALDPSMLVLQDSDIDFLHATISNDDKELRSRILDIQRNSYEIYPYPCILSFAFVMGKMSSHPAYPKVLEAGKKGNTVFIDIGCCMGTDVRKLVYDGYPAPNVLGSDLRQTYINDGHELYQDKDTCKIRFFTADAFDISARPTYASNSVPLSKVTALGELQNRVTHMYTALLFHLFDEASQYKLAIRVGSLLKRQSGAMIFGRHQGQEKAGLIADTYFNDRFIHSPASWRDLWVKVFTDLEGAEFAKTRIVVDARLRDSSFDHGKVTGRMMHWSVSIL